MAGNKNIATNQISKVQTATKVIALYDKLRVADVNHYAQLHAKGEYRENGVKMSSLIAVTIMDYSKGTGEKTHSVYFHLAPEQVQFLLTRVSAGFQEFEWDASKIYGEPDGNGYCAAQQFKIKRAVYNQKGEISRNPWTVMISNGKGIKLQNKNGGFYMKGQSYVEADRIYIQLSDMDMYMLLKRADSYITLWENTEAIENMKTGKELYHTQKKSNAQNRQYGQPYQAPVYGQDIYGQGQNQQYNQGTYQQEATYGQPVYNQEFVPQNINGQVYYG